MNARKPSAGQRRQLVGGLSFAESPRWHEGRLIVCDVMGSRVVAVEADGTLDELFAGDGSPLGGIGWLADGTLLVAEISHRRIVAVNADRSAKVFADCAALAPFWINDLLMHPSGFGFVSQMGFDMDAPPPADGQDPPAPAPLEDVPMAPLLLVNSDGSVRVAADDLHLANNLALSAGGDTLYVAEMAGRRVTTFTVADDGSLSDRRIFASFGEGHYPDGLCVDSQGALWVAFPFLGLFARVREGGDIVDLISLGADRQACACALGGPQRRTLFLLHLHASGWPESAQRQDSRVDVVTVAVPGVGLP